MSIYLAGIVDGRRQSWALDLEAPHTAPLEVGRSSKCAIALADATVSKSHAEFARVGGRWQVRDLGSRNGTRLNGEPVTEARVIRAGDVVEFGSVTLQLGEDATTPISAITGPTDPRSSIRISARAILSGDVPAPAREARIFGLLSEAGQLLVLPRPLKETCEAILEVVARAVPATRLSLLLRGPGATDLVPVASRQRGAAAGARPLAISRTIIEAVLSEATSILTTDATEDPRFREQLSIVAGSVHSAMAVPLFDNEQVLGLLYADSDMPGLSFEQEQLEILTLLANMAAVKITNARLLEAEQSRLRMQQELATAMTIQLGLLPATPPVIPGYECLARLESCYEVGGDLYDFHTTEDGALWIVQGDVTGKGMGAALLMSSFIASARVLMETDGPPDVIAARLNAIMLRTTDPMHFVTMFLGRLDPKTGLLTYINAGHSPCLLLTASGTSTLDASGPPVGMFPSMPFEVATVTLEPGALLAIFTDGIPEARRTSTDEFFEDERTESVLRGLRTHPLEAIATGLIRSVDEFLAGEARSDDITLTLIRRLA